jgi:hypothetical protein
MDDGIEKFVADKKLKYRYITIIMFIAACLMTYEFYSSGHNLIIVSNNESLQREVFFGLILEGVVTAILWSCVAQSAEAYMFTKFIGQLVFKMKRIEGNKKGEEGKGIKGKG